MKSSSTPHVLLGAVLAAQAGCTAPDSAPAPEAPPASNPAPSSLEPVAAPDPPATAKPPAPTEPAPAPTPDPPSRPEAAPVPGFVLYTREQTIILALDGSPPTLAPGLWVQDDRTSPPPVTHALVLSRARTDALALPACPCLALAGACDQDDIQLRRFDPRTGALLDDQSDDDCACIRQPEAYGMPPFVDDDGEAFPACKGESDRMVASLVAGTLYSNGWEWNGACHDSLSMYDAIDDALALVTDPPEPTSDGMRPAGCYDYGPAFVASPWPVGHGGEPTDDELCEMSESDVFMIRRGDLWVVSDLIGHAGGTRQFGRRPARPDTCPTINDPCGDPEPFRAVAKLDDRKREHWIATDGSMAITAVKQAYSLWKRDSATPIEHELPGIDATHALIGVRAHADVGRLRTLIAEHPTLGARSSLRAPETIETDQCHELHAARQSPTETKRSARAWGEDCYSRLGAEQWTSAEESCLQGLAVATEAGTKGALLYNLGRIAEGQGAYQQALEHYRGSLAARPGNATVKQRLAKLERAATAAKPGP